MFYKEPEIMTIAIIGEVSCGKTTLLNSLFLEKFGNTNKIRTTGSINIYTETDSLLVDTTDVIQTNNSIIDKNFQESACGELIICEYTVPVIKHFSRNNECKIKLRIIDIPGVNDGQESLVLVNWLKDHLNYFDVIVCMFDGQHAMNTKSQRDLYELIVKYMNPAYQHLIPIINKIDDHFDEELILMQRQCATVMKDIETKNNIAVKYDILPMSAEIAYILMKYRQDTTIRNIQDFKYLRIICDILIGKNWKNDLF